MECGAKREDETQVPAEKRTTQPMEIWITIAWKRELNFIGRHIGVAKCLNRDELIDNILEEAISRRKEIPEEMPIEEFVSKIQGMMKRANLMKN